MNTDPREIIRNRRLKTGRQARVASGFLAVLLLTGCASSYTIHLRNGTTVSSKGRPKLEGGYYRYRDAEGKEQWVNELRVREIVID